MNYSRFSPALILGLLFVLSVSDINSQTSDALFPAILPTQFQPAIPTSDANRTAFTKTEPVKFTNPIVNSFENGCVPENLNKNRFAGELSADKRKQFCLAFEKVSNELNRTNWSPELRSELESIWKVFMRENVKIRPMRKGMSKRIALAAEPFTRGQPQIGFNASVYIRPKHIKGKSFFLLAMHELRHIYDFYQLWETNSALPEAEMEKRGFRIMGRIARETRAKEKFKRLPKLWKDKWAMYAQAKIDSKMENTIEKYMRKTRFYKDRLSHPDRYIISFTNRRRVHDRFNQMSAKNSSKTQPSGSGLSNSSAQISQWDLDVPPRLVRKKVKSKKPNLKKDIVTPLTESQKKGRLPDIVAVKTSKKDVEPKTLVSPFAVAKAKNKRSSEDILKAALSNERMLYRKMNGFVYDQDFQLQCWRKQKVTEIFKRNRSVARTTEGEALFQNEKIIRTSAKKKSAFPSCLLNFESIDTDATETFWSAAYLDEMPIKFNQFTKINGVDVARYTVYKPAMEKFKQIASKYPHIQPFRVFVGTIFVSVEDSQIIKFWGSSFPEAETTGNVSHQTLASYNSTAIRQKLKSGIWVTVSVNTTAVANKRGKAKPFSYSVKYSNYRKAIQ